MEMGSSPMSGHSKSYLLSSVSLLTAALTVDTVYKPQFVHLTREKGQ